MTSANGGTYAGRYPCDGWVGNPEPPFARFVSFTSIRTHGYHTPGIIPA